MARYIRFEFINTEPIRIADASISEYGETSTLKYIPGSAIRGYVISKLAKDNPDFFEKNKKLLFSDKVQFMNAYPALKDKEMIPSPKGFYEDKSMVDGEKNIQNVVVSGEFDEGMKRAGLGQVSYFDGGTIHFGNVKTNSDFKIKIKSEDIFRNEYVVSGYRFVSYIQLPDENEELTETIQLLLDSGLRLGNSRGSGLGKCDIDGEIECSNDLPYSDYAIDSDMNGEGYLYLLSDSCMKTEEGEYIGIDLKELQDKLSDGDQKIKNLRIEFASTSKKQIAGYNRNWGGRIPTMPVYEKGSVFHLKFDGTITKKKALELMNSGVGCRKNEGFGRILFLKDYDKLNKKLKISDDAFVSVKNRYEIEDNDTMRVVATNYLRNKLNSAMKKYITANSNVADGKTSKSQMGIVDGICTQFMYNPDEAENSLRKFFKHDSNKSDKLKRHKDYRDNKDLESFVMNILESDLFELLGEKDSNKLVMGISMSELITDLEKDRLKLKLIKEMIRYSNKKEVN